MDRVLNEENRNSEFAGCDDKIRRMAKKALKQILEEELSFRQKQLIMLYYYERWSMTEIAQHLGINVSTVSRTLSRARRNILSRIKYYFIK